MNWQVYIILCSDNSFYTGITTDIERRFRQHAEGKGAKYFRGRQPVKVVLLESGHSRSSAGTREAKVKAFSHSAKMQLIEGVAREHALLMQHPEGLEGRTFPRDSLIFPLNTV